MRAFSPILAIACMCSVGLNVWMLSTGVMDSGPNQGAKSSNPALHGITHFGQKRKLRPVLPEHRTRDASALAGLSDDELKRRIAAAENEFELLSPRKERYERRERSFADEERIRPALDKVFEVREGDVRPYDVECHAGICRLDVPETKTPFEDWSDTLQSDPVNMMFKGQTYGPDAVYLELADPLNTAGLEAAYALVKQFWFSGTIRRCKEANPTPTGTVDFVVSLDRQTGRLRVEVSGTLASEACGRCVLTVLEGMIANVPAAPPGSYVDDVRFAVTVP